MCGALGQRQGLKSLRLCRWWLFLCVAHSHESVYFQFFFLFVSKKIKSPLLSLIFFKHSNYLCNRASVTDPSLASSDSAALNTKSPRAETPWGCSQLRQSPALGGRALSGEVEMEQHWARACRWWVDIVRHVRHSSPVGTDILLHIPVLWTVLLFLHQGNRSTRGNCDKYIAISPATAVSMETKQRPRKMHYIFRCFREQCHKSIVSCFVSIRTPLMCWMRKAFGLATDPRIC